MNYTLSKVLIFASGAIVGSVVTWKYLKTKYEQIANAEIESIKNYYGVTKHVETEVAPVQNDSKPETVKQPSPDVIEYRKIAGRYYDTTGEPKPVASAVEGPYVIPPEEYGELDYEQVSLIYFADEVLTDECYDPVTSINETVGREALRSFGLYEDDAVHVRNDELKKDYEILADTRNYVDVVNQGPQLTED